jgi:uncharacterized protein YndB with AHSA1/START domain
MTRDRDFKRLVRARMAKTGEAYTAARAQILDKPRTIGNSRADAARPAAAPADYAVLAGKSDHVVKQKTGCTWEGWVQMLDGLGAADMRHGEIAALINHKFRVAPWWSQMVTVGYERITGRRAVGQRADGSYEASKSRTFDVPVATLYDAWANPRRRKHWLGDAQVAVRGAIAPKSIRFGWDDGSVVAAWFTPKGAERSAVAIAHSKLQDEAAVRRLRAYWSERLDALADMLPRGTKARRVRRAAAAAATS